MTPSTIARRSVRTAKRLAMAEARAAARRRPIRDDVVFYESFSGNGATCNPRAIFDYLHAAPDFQALRHVWAIQPSLMSEPWVRELAGMRNVSVVAHDGEPYWRALSTAGYVINNATFPGNFGKREGQVYVNTWHGTPLKRMGYGIADGAPATKNIIRNFLAADYVLSSSPFMTDQMYARDYRLRNLFTGRVLEEGLPRTDMTLTPNGHLTARLELREAGVAIPGEKIALYAPTWKGESFHRPEDSTAEIRAVVERLRSALGPQWTVLAKVHQATYEQARGSAGLAEALVPNEVPANVVLAGVDFLLTDYSSIFCDFLPLGRPIAFHVPDREEYEATRGLYEPLSEFPGPLSESLDELGEIAERVRADDEDPAWHQTRLKWTERFAPYDDGAVTDRVVDTVFRGRPAGKQLIDVSSDGRPRVLINVGRMKSNGITTSVLNLMANLDHDLVDVTGFYVPHKDPDRVANIDSIDPHVRHIPQVKGMNSSLLRAFRRRRLEARGYRRYPDSVADTKLAALFHDEWVRTFGEAQFDYIVDFSGYGQFWDFLFLQGPAGSHSVWLHNDMHADARREVHGERHLFKKLHAVFSTYPYFDHLVSVSEVLAEVNAEKLAEFAPREKFTFAHNTINHRRITQRAAEPLSGEVAERIEALRAAGDTTLFVTVGRLSTEKNHERLIRAFADVRAADASARLVIVGDGPLEDHLHQLVGTLGLQDSVFLAGFRSNPLQILAACDCFVLSSDHEGQPMVILEALTVGLPIVITDFSSSAGALPEGGGLIIERSVPGLAGGMRAFLAGEVPQVPFDPQAYNRQAVGEFYRAIGLGDPTTPPTP